MNICEETKLSDVIKLICESQFVKDIKLNSYYYKLKDNIKDIIEHNWNRKELFEVIEVLMDIPVNIVLFDKEIFELLIQKVITIENDEIAKVIIKIIIKLTKFHLNSETMELIFGLYEKLNAIQTSYLTGYIIDTIKNDPLSFYELNGLNTGISMVLKLPYFPEYSYALKTFFQIKRMTDDSFPVVFSINSTTFKLTCAIEGSNKHLIIRCETSGKRTQQLYSGIFLTREYDTQFPVETERWNSLIIFHCNNKLVVELNDQRIGFPINYPSFKETVLVHLGYLKGVPGSSLIGSITGIQWLFDVNELNDVATTDWFDYESEMNRITNEKVLPQIVLNVGVSANPLESENNVLRKFVTVVNKTPFVKMEVLDTFGDYLMHPIIEVSSKRFSDIFIEDDYLTKSIHLLSSIPASNITNVIKLVFGLMVKDQKVNEWCLNRHFFTFIFDQLEVVIQKGNDLIINEHIKLVCSILNMSLNNENIHHTLVRLFSLPSKLTLQQQSIYLKELNCIISSKIMKTVHLNQIVSAKEILLMLMGEMEVSTKIYLFQYISDGISRSFLKEIVNECFSFIQNESWIVFHILWKQLSLDNPQMHPQFISSLDIFKSKIKSTNELVASYSLMIWNKLGGTGSFEVESFTSRIYQTCLYLSYDKEPQFEMDVPTLIDTKFQQEVNVLQYKPILPFLFESFQPPFTTFQKVVLTEIFIDISSCRSTHNVYQLLSSIPTWIDIISKVVVEYIDDKEMEYVLTVFYNLMKVTNTTLKQVIDILRLLLPDNKQFIQVLQSLITLFICDGHCDIEVGNILSVVCTRCKYGIETKQPLIHQQFELVDAYISHLSLHWLSDEWVHYFQSKDYNITYMLFIHLFISHAHALLSFENGEFGQFELIFTFLNFIMPLTPPELSFSFFVWYVYSIQSFFELAPLALQPLKAIALKPFPAFRCANKEFYDKLCAIFDEFNFENVQYNLLSEHLKIHQKEMEKIELAYFDDVVLIQNCSNKSIKTHVKKNSILKSLSSSRSRSNSTSPHPRSPLVNQVIISKKWQEGEMSNFNYLQYINEMEHYKYFPRLCSSFKDSVFNLYNSNKLFPIFSECLVKKEVNSIEARQNNFPSQWFYSVTSLKDIEIPKEFADSPRQCVQNLQLLLESPRISKYLNKWISSTFMGFRKEKTKKVSYDFIKLLNIFQGNKNVNKDPIFVGEIYGGEDQIQIELINGMIYFIEKNSIKSCLNKHIKMGNFIQLYKGRIDDICVVFDDGIIFGKKGMKNLIVNGDTKFVIKCGYVESVQLISNKIVIGTETDIVICNLDGIIVDKIKGHFNVFASNDCVLGINHNRIVHWKDGVIKFDVLLSEEIMFVSSGKEITYAMLRDSSFICIDEYGEIYSITSFMDVEIVISMKVMSCLMFDFIFIATRENIFIVTNRHTEMQIITAITFSSDSSGHTINDICLPIYLNESPDSWNFVVLNQDEKKQYIHLYRLDYITLTKI